VTQGDALIVDFADPPVVEVVAGVAFEGLTSDVTAYLSSFWKERLRPTFPQLEMQPPYQPSVEAFGGPAPGSGVRFEVQTGLPPTRLWASSPDHQLLIQLQPGWFACNWRKVKPNDEYDHWSKRRDAFNQWYRAFIEYLTTEGLPAPKVTQCEVTYINHVFPNEQWTSHADFDRVFKVSLQRSNAGTLEQITGQAQFLMEASGQPVGRLHVKLLPAFARDGKTPLYVLELTARGPGQGSGPDGVLQFLDRGRDAIVRAFLDLTTDEIQSTWGIVK